jgi:hypothetical protein
VRTAHSKGMNLAPEKSSTARRLAMDQQERLP